MNTQIRRLSALAGLAIVILMLATTWIQFVQAPSLNADSRNTRNLYREFGKNRGPIVVAGTPIVTSVPSDDEFNYQRMYAQGPLYSHVTGFYSITYGATGIEKTENSILNGTADSLVVQRIQDLFTGKQQQGGTVELTLNPAAQEAAAKGLGDQKGAVFAFDPTTGAVLALVSSPQYDPNILAVHSSSEVKANYEALDSDPNRPLENRAIGGYEYPPGSTFKLVTAAAALESGQYTEDTEVSAPKNLPLPGTSITLDNSGDSSCAASGTMTLKAALTISCNTAFANLGLELGDDALRQQAEAFGFDESLQIPIKASASVFPKELDQAQTAMAAIGQYDVRATPMQMAMVAGAIANNGTLMKPYLVASERDASLNVVSEGKPTVLSRPISEDTASQLKDMMTSVVDNGTGKRAQISGVQVAGKTGTAEGVKGAAPDTWFVAFAPADNPKVAIAVVVEDGGTAGVDGTGGTIAAPIAKSVMEAVLNP